MNAKIHHCDSPHWFKYACLLIHSIILLVFTVGASVLLQNAYLQLRTQLLNYEPYSLDRFLCFFVFLNATIAHKVCFHTYYPFYNSIWVDMVVIQFTLYYKVHVIVHCDIKCYFALFVLSYIRRKQCLSHELLKCVQSVQWNMLYINQWNMLLARAYYKHSVVPSMTHFA